MGKIAFKAHQFSEFSNASEYNIQVNKPISENYLLLRHWSLKEIRKMYIKHYK